ncbi:hypothetical protein N657DRAFT_560691 [Parathielavia appendiculata]|uniref:Yeast cell wall synthesis Kre9/Knh1-like N-terminal domain-containing protein n=1 Tax=Parathielavia appendiculata TaxID=2587402 RepID=A0AAN6Z7H4_9PEZI|nr:hypothetical protein N657DRAFT_560691 [Parathielavia appendiculata]
MKFSVGTVLAFAAAVLAKPVLLNSNYDIEEGEPFTLKWNNAQGPITITLMTGDPGNLKVVSDIASGVTGSEYTFTLSGIPSGNYAIRITDGSGEPNYGKLFSYSGTGSLSSSSASESATRSSSRTTVSSTTSSSSSSSTGSESETSSTTSSASSSASSSFTTTSSERPSSTRAAATTSATAPPNTNGGQRFASPLAFVLVTVAALVFFN